MKKYIREFVIEIEQKIREYFIKKYGEPNMSQIKGYRKNEPKKSKCDMCSEHIYGKESFRYVPLLAKLVKYDELWICKPCAKREHGSRNKYKWNELLADLKKGVG